MPFLQKIVHIAHAITSFQIPSSRYSNCINFKLQRPENFKTTEDTIFQKSEAVKIAHAQFNVSADALNVSADVRHYLPETLFAMTPAVPLFLTREVVPDF